ncbi:MAG TPA: proline dehydrogenase family protein [Bryobacteraceae bacterium]|nr:proline dehydrogenase family protein [Bryobacteraceae bacterium]
MPLRQTLLYMSRQPALRRMVETSFASRALAHRFVAGATLKEALTVCRRIRGEGISATLDYLGENVTSLDQATACRDTYLRVLGAMREAGLEPNVSLKLTQFGLDLSEADCEANVAALVRTAAGMGGFVRIDMESSAYTDRTLGIVSRLHAKYGACGTVIQSYLRRSERDIAALIPQKLRVRLCKGAYLEPPEVAFEAKQEVDQSYFRLACTLLQEAHYPAIATHDERMIQKVQQFAAENRIARDQFEFQMLYGIRRDLQSKLVAEGYRLRLYIPFGEAWYPYFMRRLAERPANLLFLIRNLLHD